MKNSNIIEKSDIQQLSDQKLDEVETIYSGQKPQFQQSANKPQKTKPDHPKHTELWE